MSTTLKLEVVTPRGQVYTNDVEMVTLPGREGEMGILPAHAPLITLLGDGEIVAKTGSDEDRILVTGGCANITGDRVAILTIFATDEDKIDVGQAEEARRRAEERLKEELTPEETALVQSALAHSLSQIRFKRRKPRSQP